jgi:hypothetical protein
MRARRVSAETPRSAVCLQGYDSASIQAKAKALTMELLLSKTLLSQ